jgi:hypothetical protein
LYKGEVFLYIKEMKDSEWCAIVMSVGVTDGTFRAVFVLKSFEEDISNESVEMSFTVDLIDASDKAFRYGRCLILDEDAVNNFIKKDKMNMMVSIEEIPKNLCIL